MAALTRSFVARISALITFIIVLVIAMVSVSFVLAHRVNQNTKDIYNRDIQMQNAANLANTGFLTMDDQSNMWLGLHSFHNPILSKQTYDQILQGEQQLNAGVSKLQSLANTPQLVTLIRHTKSDAAAYENYFSQINQDYTTNYQAAAQIMYIGNTQVSNRLTADLSQIQTYAQSRLKSHTSTTFTATNVLNNVILYGGILVVLISIGILFFVRVSVRPLPRLVKMASELKKGNLSARAMVKSRDEFGRLAASFNETAEHLGELIRDVAQSAEQLAASSEELIASAEETSRAAEQVAANIQASSEASGRQSMQMSDSVGAVKEMSRGIEQIAESAQAVSEQAQGAFATAKDGKAVVADTIEQMTGIGDSVANLGQVIETLATHSGNIGEMVTLISEIASETNLLALNASIEAARAGEHGKGFAVVASEVRKLADQSARTAEQITQVIRGIQTTTNDAITSMDKARQDVESGVRAVHKSGAAFEEIQTSVQHVANQMVDVSAATQQVSATSEDVLNSMELIAEFAEEMRASSEEIAASTEEQLATMQEVTASSSMLAQLAESLQEKTRQFEV